MAIDHRLPRLFVEGPLDENGDAMLFAREAHYLRHVMRRGPGDSVILFNGRDGEWEGTITALRKAGGAVRLVRLTRPQQAEPDLWLLFALLKKAPLDNLVVKATELGVSVLWPVSTRHTVVARVNVARLRAQVVEAAEQCERLTVPDIHAPQPLDAALDAWPRDRRLFVCDETGGGAPIMDALARAAPGPAAFLLGPEGGFARSELDRLRELPFATLVGLGPRVLRADTAALAALACWQAKLGDWRERPAFRSPFSTS